MRKRLSLIGETQPLDNNMTINKYLTYLHVDNMNFLRYDSLTTYTKTQACIAKTPCNTIRNIAIIPILTTHCWCGYARNCTNGEKRRLAHIGSVYFNIQLAVEIQTPYPRHEDSSYVYNKYDVQLSTPWADRIYQLISITY